MGWKRSVERGREEGKIRERDCREKGKKKGQERGKANKEPV
jgi:predicted transposase YdaD